MDRTPDWMARIEQVKRSLIMDIDTKIEKHLQEKSRVFDSIKSSGVLVTPTVTHQQADRSNPTFTLNGHS